MSPLSIAAFLEFCQTAESVGATSSRLEKARLLGLYFGGLSDQNLRRAALYFGGTLFPLREGRVVNVGGAALLTAIREISNADDDWLRQRLVARGDAGDVAQEAFAVWENAPQNSVATLETIESAIDELAATRGSKLKILVIQSILALCTALEAKFWVKMLSGDLRIGLKEGAVEDALARLSNQSVAQIQRANMLTGDLGEVALLARHGRLETAKFQLFHPLKFMLATPAADLGDVARQMPDTFAVEDKFDGIRAQIHLGWHLEGDELLHGTLVETSREATESLHEATEVQHDPTKSQREPHESLHEGREGIHEATEAQHEPTKAQREAIKPLHEPTKAQREATEVQHEPTESQREVRVALFSRTLDELTSAFPDLHAALAQLLPAHSPGLVLDGEIVPIDGEKILPFQILQKRLGRKTPSSEIQTQIPVAFVAYDVLFAGDNELEAPFSVRRAVLETLKFDGLGARLASSKTFENVAALDEEFDAARGRGNEGLMVKDPRAPYKPGRRGREWLKIKRAVATLDVVVTSVESGSGRRSKFYSDYTFAVRASDSDDTLLNVGKAYSGLTDAEITALNEWFLAHTTQTFAHGRVRVVEPKIVLEIAFDRVQVSPRHKSGFALRFPRILRIRDDKPVGEIDTLETVARLAN